MVGTTDFREIKIQCSLELQSTLVGDVCCIGKSNVLVVNDNFHQSQPWDTGFIAAQCAGSQFKGCHRFSFMYMTPHSGIQSTFPKEKKPFGGLGARLVVNGQSDPCSQLVYWRDQQEEKN